MTYSSPSRLAVVRMPATSEPPSGSVIASEPISRPVDRRPHPALDLVGVAGGDEVRQRDAGREQRREQPAGRRRRSASPRPAPARRSRRRPRRRPLGVGQPEQPELGGPLRAASAAARRRAPIVLRYGSTSPLHEAPHGLAQRAGRASRSARGTRSLTAAPPGCRRRASAATRRAPWPAGRAGRWTRRPRRARPRRRSSARAGWAARAG